MRDLRSEELIRHFDIAVIGSGFAGSLFAMIAHQLGKSVVLIDRGKHPRVVIGESSTPLANLLWEELTTRYDLRDLKPLAKWGTWQKERPEIACGLKRGFTFYHHDRANPRAGAPRRAEQLLVAASPHDEIADTHWYRADFDHFLVRQAESLGVEYLDQANLTAMRFSSDRAELEGERAGTGPSVSEEERQANLAGADFCVPQNELDLLFARKGTFISERDMVGFARRLQIHPGIAVGQIQNRRGQFNWLRKYLVKIRQHVLPGAVADGWGQVAPVTL